MAGKAQGRKAKSRGQPRASITFPPKLYKTLEALARQNKVSIAWVVRDAVEKYVDDQRSVLLRNEGNPIT
ncbi:MAG: ribbon-helix-helix protein, CopG family [Bryobacteraceae bacterium]|nr:ribbon-helix-helix protein, CopG family [Bryobacteraceae bacterium]